MTNIEGTQLLQSFSDAVAKLAEKVSPSVVQIDVGRTGGTGTVWSSDGYIVTANHVVGDAKTGRVRLGDGRDLEAAVVGRDMDTDVALLKVNAEGLAPIARGEAGVQRVGQFVLALANAFGKQVSATSGIVTSSTRSVKGWSGTIVEGAVVTDAKLNPGHSGGPIVDASGRMLGMNVAHFAGRGIAVPVDSLSRMVETLARDGKVKRRFLGVVVEPVGLPEEVAALSGVGQDGGLVVLSVEKNSPAKKAGVAIGDVVLRLGEALATDHHELRRALSGETVGKTVSLWVLRGEELTELKVEPEEVEEQS